MSCLAVTLIVSGFIWGRNNLVEGLLPMPKNNTKKYSINTLEYSLISTYVTGIIRAVRYTFKDFQAEYPDDDACLRSVLENRYGNTCPKCGSMEVKFYPISGRKGFVCSECRGHVYPLAGTIFHKSETSLWSWFYAMYLFSVSKNGVAATELQRQLGVTYKTAWRMARQIRLLMASEGGMLDGEVEIDETYIGGHHKKSTRHSKKSTVFGAVERGGMVKATHVKTNGARVLIPEIHATITPGTHIYSDEWPVYNRLNRIGYSHTTVTHKSFEWVRGKTHTNTIEGFWSQLKRSIDGTYHAVSPKHLQLYLNEFVFRYNHRHVPVLPYLLQLVVTRV